MRTNEEVFFTLSLSLHSPSSLKTTLSNENLINLFDLLEKIAIYRNSTLMGLFKLQEHIIICLLYHLLIPQEFLASPRQVFEFFLSIPGSRIDRHFKTVMVSKVSSL